MMEVFSKIVGGFQLLTIFTKKLRHICFTEDGLRDHLRDVPWEDIFKLGASAAASEFCEWIQVGIDVYIQGDLLK